MTDFLEQYKANCRNYVRRTPYRLLRLVVAFVAALVLAPICALVARLTGEPRVAAVIGVVGALFVLGTWILVERLIERTVEGPAETNPPLNTMPPAYPASPFQPTFGVLNAEVVHSSQPIDWQPRAAPPAKGGAGGCAIAFLAILGVSTLLCCGGGVALFAIGASAAGAANQNRVVRQNDPVFELQQDHNQQLEEMIRGQEDQLRQFERDLQQKTRGPDW